MYQALKKENLRYYCHYNREFSFGSRLRDECGCGLGARVFLFLGNFCPSVPLHLENFSPTFPDIIHAFIGIFLHSDVLIKADRLWHLGLFTKSNIANV